MNIKSILKENTWGDIIWASEHDCIPNTWKVGDEINLTLSGKFNETVTLQIWDFNHYDKSDGTGKANICFGMKHLMKNTQQMNAIYTNTGGWNDSYMKNVVMKNIYESIPEYIRNNIKEVNTYASSIPLGKGSLSKDKVFIPGLTEVDDSWIDQNQTETGQKKFPIFSNDSSRIKRLNNGSGRAEWWWTRSPICGSDGHFCFFDTDGDWYIYYADSSRGVCFCFNI